MSRYNIKINHSKVSSNLINFPVFVKLDDIIEGMTTEQADSIRVYESNGTTEVAREVVSEKEMHFLATAISSSVDTSFIIDIDGIRDDYSANVMFGSHNVWGGYRMVSHDGGSTDSTANGNNGSETGTVSAQSGKIGKCTQFSGGYIDISDNSSLSMENIHISFWGKTASVDTSYIIDKKGGTLGSVGDGSFMFGISSLSGTGLSFSLSNGAATSRLNSGNEIEFRGSSEWAKLDLRYDGTTQDIYINGNYTSSGTGSGLLGNSNNNLRIGSGVSTPQPFIGYLDEIRIMSTAMTNEWIYTEYENQLNPSEFYTVTQLTATGNMFLMF